MWVGNGFGRSALRTRNTWERDNCSTTSSGGAEKQHSHLVDETEIELRLDKTYVKTKMLLNIIQRFSVDVCSSFESIAYFLIKTLSRAPGHQDCSCFIFRLFFLKASDVYSHVAFLCSLLKQKIAQEK